MNRNNNNHPISPPLKQQTEWDYIIFDNIIFFYPALSMYIALPFDFPDVVNHI